MLRHVPRVDFETCERVAAYAVRVERGETLEGEGESESESESEETRENDADEPGTKSWRKRTLETRVRRVLRAKALADAPVGTRRACRLAAHPRSRDDGRRWRRDLLRRRARSISGSSATHDALVVVVDLSRARRTPCATSTSTTPMTRTNSFYDAAARSRARCRRHRARASLSRRSLRPTVDFRTRGARSRAHRAIWFSLARLRATG